MASKTSEPERLSARDRLLAAAGELFYEEGINTVGIDRVIERAGVAKASLYNSFGSKEELIRSYLLVRQGALKTRIQKELARYEKPKERLLGIFDALGRALVDPKFRGCPFVRASAEIRAESSVKTVCDETRAWLRTLFADLAREAGAAKPDALAQRLVLLYDGALVSAQMDRNPGAAADARDMAALLLDAATRS